MCAHITPWCSQIERVARGMQLPPELTAQMFFSFVAKAGRSGDKAVAAGDKAGATEDKAVTIDEGAFLTAHRHARALFEGHSHVKILMIYELGFNENNYTFTSILLIKIVL